MEFMWLGLLVYSGAASLVELLVSVKQTQFFYLFIRSIHAIVDQCLAEVLNYHP